MLLYNIVNVIIFITYFSQFIFKYNNFLIIDKAKLLLYVIELIKV